MPFLGAILRELKSRCAPDREREFFIDNLLVRTHLIMSQMFWWTGLAPDTTSRASERERTRWDPRTG